ncbi:hypothetical protein PSTG_16081 [Puccinia striiformis f. sp. tritici PST-78]|uniref:Uncharacterized protein n=1 Tax=Puccinia striiformis f. sp. tritici PST-78 TaxID=1165861 RepID=A0A0L0UTU4_9BASI|nr:hypothetical protein PSTG_16081 [Puccinia striiformis f. sp. tritici PST-78]
MTRSSKKRRKVPSSPLSSVNSTPARSQETSQIRQKTTHPDSDPEERTTDVESTTPGGTQSSTTRVLTDKQELGRIVKLHANQLSACYTSFDVPRLSDRLDKHHRKMIAFPSVANILIGRRTKTLQQTLQSMSQAASKNNKTISLLKSLWPWGYREPV